MTDRAKPPSVFEASAASVRRAWRLIIAQLIVLAGVLVVAKLCGWRSPAPVVDVTTGTPDAGGAAPDAVESPCADEPACRAACNLDGGSRAIEACVRRADMLRLHRGGAVSDRIAARNLYREACLKTRDAVACTRLALGAGLLRDLDLAPDWLDPALAPLPMLADACRTGGTRGALACAALELTKADATLAPDGRSQLCRDPLGPSTAVCAADVAARACKAEDDAEACFLAARDGLPTMADARKQLRALCEAPRPDRAACLYRYWVERDNAALLAACSELDSEQTVSLATACLERAVGGGPRRAEMVERACKLGACQAPNLQPPITVPRRILDEACKAGHLNGCAVLIFRDAAKLGDDVTMGRRPWSGYDPMRAKQTREWVTKQWPQYARYGTANPDEADLMACRLGSIDGCKLAIARGANHYDTPAAALKKYSALLAEPLKLP